VKKKLPEPSVRRLFYYTRLIMERVEKGEDIILSEEIGTHFSQDPSQVRKDLSLIGLFGRRGKGYNLLRLKEGLNKYLMLETSLDAVLIGCGKLGSAILAYPILQEFSFNIIRAFDVDPMIVGKSVHNVYVSHIDELCDFLKKNKNVSTAILTVPADKAKDIAEKIVECGIKGILNFAPVFLNLQKKAIVRNVDFSVDFNILRYEMFKEKKL